MKADAKRAPQSYREITGQSLSTFGGVALLNVALQVVLFYEMTPVAEARGEFGLFNAALGIISLLALPAPALVEAFRLFFARAQDTRLDRLRDSRPVIVESFAWVWGACCFVLVLIPLPLPALPRFALQLFVLMNVLLVLGAQVSFALRENAGRLRAWGWLVIAAAVVRTILAGCAGAFAPWAEAALAAFLVAGLMTLVPALQPRDIDIAARIKACATVLDRDFLLFTGATLSAILAIYLFTGADRIAAVGWLHPRATDASTNYLSEVGQSELDYYQAAGMLMRAILWGTQPLLWLFYAERSKLTKTTPASLIWFWIYLVALVVLAVLYSALCRRWMLGADFTWLQHLGPSFASMTILLGLLQGLATFALASRRYLECFLLGGCGIIYALALAALGHRPDIMLQDMFGGSLILIMAVLFVGVVRWGRRQP